MADSGKSRMAKPRQRADNVASRVKQWLDEMAAVHELQPDRLQIHLSHPTSNSVYQEYMSAVQHGIDKTLLPCDPRYFLVRLPLPCLRRGVGS